ncbi:MAG: hypothetical protein AVO33_11155 [delta proteobacterium ML8_F1]|nr:MAG: hypothetical protein AVO33_11155 [delta proteobacterium ML8_F1]
MNTYFNNPGRIDDDPMAMLLDTLHCGVLVLDPELNIRQCNRAVVEISGYSPEELSGRSIASLLTGVDFTAIAAPTSGFQARGFVTLVSKSGESRVLDLRTRALFSDQKPNGIILSLDDMTQRLLVYDDYAESQRILKALTLAVGELIENTDYRFAITRALGRLAGASVVDRIYLYRNYRHEQDGDATRLIYGLESIDLKNQTPALPLEGISLASLSNYMPALFEGQACQGTVTEIQPGPTRDHLLARGIASIAVFPILVKDALWGFAGFESCDVSRPWTREFTATLGALVSSLEKTVERDVMQRELTAAREMAERASAMKSQFLSNMSHEIRTPINAILGYTSLLEDSVIDDDGRHYLSAVHKAGNMLVGLISDILDLAKIESGEIVLQQDYINIRRIYEDIGEVFELKTREKNIALSLHIAPDIPDIIVQDETRFRQVLFNLVGNAVKFTHEGGIQLHARKLEPSKATGGVDLSFSVKDTGIGIPENEMEQIFEPFKQKIRQNASVYGGTGLGLSIARRLVEQMGGEMLLASTPGEGSEFTINLYGVKVLNNPGSFSEHGQQTQVPLKTPVPAGAFTPESPTLPLAIQQPLKAVYSGPFQEALRTQSMQTLRSFAGEIAAIAADSDFQPLVLYSNALGQALRTYNAGKIRELLESFPHLAQIEGGDLS